MKPLPTFIVILGLTGLAVAWQVIRQPAPDELSPATESASPEVPVAAAESPALQPIERPADPSLNEPTSDNADLAAASNGIETEMVLGIEVRKDRNCTVEIRYVYDPKTAQAAEVYICTPNEPPPSDPYESWDIETLAAMAYGDAHAAEVLGLRHLALDDPMQEELGLALIYRSVAMSGDFDTFRKAIVTRYPYTSIDGEPQIKSLKQSAIFAAIASKLGDDSLNPGFYFDYLKRAHVDDDELKNLSNKITNIMRVMAAIQTETTGDSTIREAIENA